MSKEKIQVVILGKVHTIVADEDKQYLQNLASYIDYKLREVINHPSYRTMSHENRQLFTQLNLAEDYVKAKEWIEKLEKDKENTKKEIYELKEKIVQLELELSHSKGRLSELEKINNAKEN